MSQTGRAQICASVNSRAFVRLLDDKHAICLAKSCGPAPTNGCVLFKTQDALCGQPLTKMRHSVHVLPVALSGSCKALDEPQNLNQETAFTRFEGSCSSGPGILNWVLARLAGTQLVHRYKGLVTEGIVVHSKGASLVVCICARTLSCTQKPVSAVLICWSAHVAMHGPLLMPH